MFLNCQLKVSRRWSRGLKYESDQYCNFRKNQWFLRLRRGRLMWAHHFRGSLRFSRRQTTASCWSICSREGRKSERFCPSEKVVCFNSCCTVCHQVLATVPTVERVCINHTGRAFGLFTRREEWAGDLMGDELDASQEGLLVLLVADLLQPQLLDAGDRLDLLLVRPLKVNATRWITEVLEHG